ncbi:MAG: MATE family efflux transporter [Spirochaetaceae bacterium]|jgi:putative MATE family efflux protein|nr:MATE family efflux transporter [Spirochaetaceae bacterium]
MTVTETPENKMAVMPVGRLLFSMSLPLMLSMIMEALYNVVDSLFIARVSEKALTALTLAFPVQLLVVSITVGAGVGVNALLSRQLGEKDQRGVDQTAINGVFLSALTYVLFLLFGLFLTRPYFAWQTDDPEICQAGVEYLSICMILSFGSVGQILFQRLLQSTGRTGLSMVSQLVGAAVNIVFDPILIFGLWGFPKMGVTGAAIATVAGQIIAMGIALFFTITKNKDVRLRLRNFRPDLRVISAIYRVGAPAIVNQSLNSLMAFGVNIILIKLSATAVAAFGIYIRIQNFVLMPAFGVNNGVIAIGAFNYGARNKRRIDATLKYGIIIAGSILVTGTMLIQALTVPLLNLFDASDTLMDIGSAALHIISLSYVFVALTLIMQGICQALGNGLYSLIITLMRVVIVLLPALSLFAKLFALNQIWWAFVLAEAVSAIVGAFLLKQIYREKVKPLDPQSAQLP